MAQQYITGAGLQYILEKIKNKNSELFVHDSNVSTGKIVPKKSDNTNADDVNVNSYDYLQIISNQKDTNNQKIIYKITDSHTTFNGHYDPTKVPDTNDYKKYYLWDGVPQGATSSLTTEFNENTLLYNKYNTVTDNKSTNITDGNSNKTIKFITGFITDTKGHIISVSSDYANIPYLIGSGDYAGSTGSNGNYFTLEGAKKLYNAIKDGFVAKDSEGKVTTGDLVAKSLHIKSSTDTTDKATIDESGGITANNLNIGKDSSNNPLFKVDNTGNVTGQQGNFKTLNVGTSTNNKYPFSIDDTGNITNVGNITSNGGITGKKITGDSFVINGKTYGIASDGAITGASLSVGSGNITGGAITGSSIKSTGTISGGAITGTSLNVNGGTISGGAITGGAITGTSLSVGQGQVTAGGITVKNNFTDNTGNVAIAETITKPTSPATMKDFKSGLYYDGSNYIISIKADNSKKDSNALNISTSGTGLQYGLVGSNQYTLLDTNNSSVTQDGDTTTIKLNATTKTINLSSYYNAIGYKQKVTNADGTDKKDTNGNVQYNYNGTSSNGILTSISSEGHKIKVDSISYNDLRTNLGLSNALHFRGIIQSVTLKGTTSTENTGATVDINGNLISEADKIGSKINGKTIDEITITLTDGNPLSDIKQGDVVVGSNGDEYLYDGSHWQHLGQDSSFLKTSGGLLTGDLWFASGKGILSGENGQEMLKWNNGTVLGNTGSSTKIDGSTITFATPKNSSILNLADNAVTIGDTNTAVIVTSTSTAINTNFKVDKDGNITIDGSKTLTINGGTFTTSGVSQFNGNVTIGKSDATKNLTVNGTTTINGNILATGHNLGSSTEKLSNIYVENLHASSIGDTNSQFTGSSITVNTANITTATIGSLKGGAITDSIGYSFSNTGKTSSSDSTSKTGDYDTDIYGVVTADPARTSTTIDTSVQSNEDFRSDMALSVKGAAKLFKRVENDAVDVSALDIIFNDVYGTNN